MREKLKACRTMQIHIQILERRKDVIRSLLDTQSPQLTTIPMGTPNHDRILDCVAKLNEIDKQLSQLILDTQYDYMECIHAIEELPTSERIVMELYYIEGMTQEQVAEQIDCSVRHCQRLLQIGLKKIESCRVMSC